jgi:hypothetical protein
MMHHQQETLHHADHFPSPSSKPMSSVLTRAAEGTALRVLTQQLRRVRPGRGLQAQLPLGRQWSFKTWRSAERWATLVWCWPHWPANRESTSRDDDQEGKAHVEVGSCRPRGQEACPRRRELHRAHLDRHVQGHRQRVVDQDHGRDDQALREGDEAPRRQIGSTIASPRMTRSLRNEAHATSPASGVGITNSLS